MTRCISNSEPTNRRNASCLGGSAHPGPHRAAEPEEAPKQEHRPAAEECLGGDPLIKRSAREDRQCDQHGANANSSKNPPAAPCVNRVPPSTREQPGGRGATNSPHRPEDCEECNEETSDISIGQCHG